MHGHPLHAVPGMLVRRGIGIRPEYRPAVQRGVLSAIGSAQLVVGFVLGERRGRSDARRSSRRSRPIGESSDYQTSTPSPRRIRARILTQRFRGAGAVLRTPRRCAAMTSRPPLLVATPLLGSGGGGINGGGGADLLRKRCCSAGSCCSRRASDGWGRLRTAAASTTSCSALRGRESSLQIGALRRALVAYVCCGVPQALCSLPGGLFAQAASRTGQTKRSQLPVDILALGS